MANEEEFKSYPYISSLKTSLYYVVFFVLVLALACFFEFSPLLVTLCILLLPTIFFLTFSKKKHSMSSPKNLIKKELEGDINEVPHVEECEVEAEDFPSDSETTNEDSFELSCLRPANTGSNLAMFGRESGSSVSDDEDNLIEINLPKDDDSVGGSKPKLQLDVQEAFLSQEKSLVDGVREVYEEENLIEIDLSIGSIKYSTCV